MKKACDCICHKRHPEGMLACSMCGVTNGRHTPNFLARHTSISLSYVGRNFPVSEVKTWTREQMQEANEWVSRCLQARPEPPEFLKRENCQLMVK